MFTRRVGLHLFLIAALLTSTVSWAEPGPRLQLKRGDGASFRIPSLQPPPPDDGPKIQINPEVFKAIANKKKVHDLFMDIVAVYENMMAAAKTAFIDPNGQVAGTGIDFDSTYDDTYKGVSGAVDYESLNPLMNDDPPQSSSYKTLLGGFFGVQLRLGKIRQILQPDPGSEWDGKLKSFKDVTDSQSAYWQDYYSEYAPAWLEAFSSPNWMHGPNVGDKKVTHNVKESIDALKQSAEIYSKYADSFD